MTGYGSILRIDLTSGKVSSAPIPEELCRRFVGGAGINTWLLWEHFLKVDPRIDPLSADNVLIAGIGPLGATPYGGGTKMKWTFKSPAYNMYGDSTCGGHFGAQLRWAGYDHVVITGKASKPVYIWIDDDTVEVRDASRMWGRDVDETDHLIKMDLGTKEVEIAGIGQAGENLVTYASIIADRHRVAGRGGSGCVMGSKNLKAIAVRGAKGLEVSDPKAFMNALDLLIGSLNTMSRERDAIKLYGTLRLTAYYQRVGGNAWRNCQFPQIPEENFNPLSQRWYRDHIAYSSYSCSPGCLLSCSGTYKVKGNESPTAHKFAGMKGYKPEYLSLASLGIMTGIADFPAMGDLNDRVRKYGLDCVEVGACCGLLMELWQRGIITEADTREWLGAPLSLEWGNHDAAARMIDSIALQKNRMGNLLKAGVYKAAQRLEELKSAPILKYALYGKGGSPFNEEVRQFPSWATNMAVSSRGADHLKGLGTLDKFNRRDIAQHYFGDPKAAEPLDITLKGAGSAVAENYTPIVNCLGVCTFVVDVDPINFPPRNFALALKAATGLEFTEQELLAAAERVANLEKAFNTRLGLRREDDKLCERWLNEPEAQGYGKGWKAADYLEKTKDEYYEYHGWDKKTGLQTRKKLEQLGMQDIAEVLAREGGVA
ncbi:MAG: hypothetical protein HY671_08120 [Chloroflexi bacterium]|nr:hypothetical protein [Chloroflexota bacterium]